MWSSLWKTVGSDHRGRALPNRADASSTILPIGVAYAHALTNYAIDHAAESEVVKRQLADPEVNVLTGERFDAVQRKTDLDISSCSR